MRRRYGLAPTTLLGHLLSRQAPHLAGSSPKNGTSDGIRIRITPVTRERPKPLDDTGKYKVY